MIAARLAFRVMAFIALCIMVIGIQSILLKFYRGPKSYIVPWLWQNGIRKSFGIKVIVEGTPVRDRQTLYVGNHLSYLDIPVVGSFVFGSFIARGDLARWPLFGLLSKTQQTVFISRERKDAAREKDAIEQLIREGKNLIIFAEGTSSDGSSVLPFKSSLFGLALSRDNPAHKPMTVQPFTISLLAVDGRPATGNTVRDQYAWHGDMTLPPHIKSFARLRGATIKLTFHPPRDAALYNDRKALCQDCYNDVARGLALPPLARAA